MANRVDWQNAVDTNVDSKNINSIYLTGAGHIDYEFKGVSRDSALGWQETVWGGDLTRSTDFILTNIDDVDFGLVARLEISYKYMNVQDYKVLSEIATQRVCYATYYNRQTASWVIRQEMSFTGNELAKLHTYGTKYLGEFDVSIKLVATNRDRADLIGSSFAITFNANGGADNRAVKPETGGLRWSSALKLPVEATSSTSTDGFYRSGYHLVGWNTAADGSGGAYLPNQPITVWSAMTLYAQWEAST